MSKLLVNTRYCRRMETRTCRRCGETKSIDSYYKEAKRPSMMTICKTCHNARTRSYYAQLTDEDKQERWTRRRAKTYGMTTDEMASMYQEQDGRCYLCQRECGSISRKRGTWDKGLTVDHDHVTGVVRRALCSNCNMALGFARDDPDLLRRMADYIELHREGLPL